jgi:hypothetical protein
MRKASILKESGMRDGTGLDNIRDDNTMIQIFEKFSFPRILRDVPGEKYTVYYQ